MEIQLKIVFALCVTLYFSGKHLFLAFYFIHTRERLNGVSLPTTKQYHNSIIDFYL